MEYGECGGSIKRADFGCVGSGNSLRGSESAVTDEQTTQTPAPDAGLVAITVTQTGCVNGQVCGVVIYSIFNECAPMGGGLSQFSYAAHTDYSQSLNGGQTWTSVYSASHDYGSGHGSSCPPPTGPESATAAGPPPAGDPVTFSGVRAGTNDTGTITWTPANPPSYIISQFGS